MIKKCLLLWIVLFMVLPAYSVRIQKETPTVYKPYLKEISKTKIPVYVPTYFPLVDPFKGKIYITNAKFGKDYYHFSLYGGEGIYQPMSDWIISVAAEQNVSLTNPNEESYEKTPKKFVNLHGMDMISYEERTMYRWKNGKWDCVAIGHGPGAGEDIARELISAFPKDFIPIEGIKKGKIIVSQTGNPMYVDAKWTYDGKTWYQLYGRGNSCSVMITMLSMMKLN